MRYDASMATYVSKAKSYNGAGHWTLPPTMESCRELRRIFGDRLEIGPALDSWARAQVAVEANLARIVANPTASLKRLPTVLPALYEAIHLGPLGRWMTPEQREKALRGPASFQAADVAFLSTSANPLNGNHPGLGKTLETIAAIFEAGAEDGPKIVIAPKSALNAVWMEELQEWQDQPVYVSTGDAKRKDAVIAAFESEIVAEGFSGWLIVNADQVRYRESFEPCRFHLGKGIDAKAKKLMRLCPQCEIKKVSEYPTLHAVKWSVIVLDECHRGIVRNPGSLTSQGVQHLKLARDGKRMALTGTPMGGKILNLWGILRYLNPVVFRSKWRFAEMWSDISENGFGRTIGKSLRHCKPHHGIDDEAKGRPDCRECRQIEVDFDLMLSRYMTRRTKAECLPWLPPKQFVPVMCEFGSARHAKQYEDFRKQSMTVIDGKYIYASNVLEEYTRLKQFAFSRHELGKNGKLMPTSDSGKLEALRQLLDDLGIWSGESKEQMIIFSQFSQVVDLIHSWLNDSGVVATKITGAISGEARAKVRRAFQAGDARVCVVTTTAGGVAITLDAASHVAIMDETFDPDDQEQAEDRAHRASRIHQVTCYYFRTKGSIDEKIAVVTGSKSSRNTKILDSNRLNALAGALRTGTRESLLRAK